MFNSTEYTGGKLIQELKGGTFKRYMAHTCENHKELLYEHSFLVSNYGDALINKHSLNSVIELLASDFAKLNYKQETYKTAEKYILDMFFSTLAYHDIGKINPNFQYVKMDEKSFRKKQNSLGSDHSKISAYIFIQDFIHHANNPDYCNEEKIINVFCLLSFSTIILSHHSPQINDNHEFNFDEEFIEDAFELLKTINSDYFPVQQQKVLIQKLNNQFLSRVYDFLQDSQPFLLFSLLKLNYSLLTASDYLATTHYMDNWENIPEDFGILTKNLKQRIIRNAEDIKPYNKKTYAELEGYSLEFPTQQSNKNLNILRQNLAVEIINGIRNNPNERLFYIEAPTGSGKTNLSMLALAELLRLDIEKSSSAISKVFYVFPFTTLITQTYTSLLETLGLSDNEIVQIHSKAGFTSKNAEQYGNSRENIIDYQFLNYPVTLLSHIRFFDILKSNKKSTNYILHRLANSVVIIDELQTYSPKQWDKVIFYINLYAKYYNIRFIIMSATLPKIEQLLSKESEIDKKDFSKFIYLNKNKDKYFTNPNFKNRVEIDFSILEEIDFKNMDDEARVQKLWELVVEKSNLYLNKGNQRVHTIIEFIYKKTAGHFFETIKERNKLFDDIFILSGTILEPRRKDVIHKLKSKELNDKNILLITTQVVEAGVDIDMDIGFKDTSLIDSDEQLAGRINRNVNKTNSKLYLFNMDDAKVIYGTDDRFEKMQTELSGSYKNILSSKKFDIIYNCVMDYRNSINSQTGGFVNLQTYKKSILNLNFADIHKEFTLIENNISTAVIFIPFKIPVNIPGSKERNFEKNELTFLANKGVYKKEDGFISGSDIWHLYTEFIEAKHKDFSSNKIQKVIFQGLLSKYSISVSIYSKEFKNAVDTGAGEEKYGFYYLNYIDDVYDYNYGFKVCEIDSAIIF